jgi:cell division septal protein FtsQ
MRTHRRNRGRWAALALLAGILGAAGLGLLWRVEKVTVRGAAAADPGLLAQAAQEAFGERLFQLPRSRARAVLARDPWIRAVRLRPTLGGTLVVRVEESTPVFVLEKDGAGVCADGRVLPPRRHVDLSGLPRLRAPRREGRADLTGAATEMVRHLCAALDRTPWTWPSGLGSVELREGGDVLLTTGRGVEVVLGPESWDRRLTALAAALPMLRPGPGDRLDLRFERQVILAPAAAGRTGG